MADIKLTGKENVYTQPEADKTTWNRIFGGSGKDVIRLYQGEIIGGAGNDTLEKIVLPNERRDVWVSYWDSGNAVTVNLQEGWATDGFGGRDTLINIDNLNAGGGNDVIIGNSNDNGFNPGNGDDTILGGGGNDWVGIPGFQPADLKLPWRSALFEDVDITVSADGKSAFVKLKSGTGFSYSLTDVESIRFYLPDGRQQLYQLKDAITQDLVAKEAIAAGNGFRWNAESEVGTSVKLTFGFVTKAPSSGVGSVGFRAFTVSEQETVRSIFAQISKFAAITFTEITANDASAAQIRLGVSQQADTKGVSWLPGQANAGDLAGDIWMDIESMLDLSLGSEGYQALLHEIGHALGLKHPRNVDPQDKWAKETIAEFDQTVLTVMSQTKSADGLFRSEFGPLDILALRYLYGSTLSNTGNDTYKLGDSQSNAQTTIHDDGGLDTINATALLTGVNISLKPGSFSSIGFNKNGFTSVNNLIISSTSVIENLVGSNFDDVLVGNDLDNRLDGSLGNDWIEGGLGNDVAVFSGKFADYKITNNFGKVFVAGLDGRSGFDTLIDIEQLEFADKKVVTDSLTVTGQMKEGQTLTANPIWTRTSQPLEISYQWKLNGRNIDGATAKTLLLKQEHVNGLITLEIEYAFDADTPESLYSKPTVAVSNQNDRPTGEYAIIGNATQGQTLSIKNTLRDPDGAQSNDAGGLQVWYRWKADGVELQGEYSSTLLLTESHVGKVIVAESGYRDWAGTDELVTSAPTAKVANVNDKPAGNISIVGTPNLGNILQVKSVISDADGLGAFQYQWRANGLDIKGATASSFLIENAQLGQVISLQVSFVDGHGTKETLVSKSTSPVALKNNAPTGKVSFTGALKQDSVLQATQTLTDADGLGTVKYQWFADDQAILGASSAQFQLTEQQVGKIINVVASYVDGIGNSESVSSFYSRPIANVNDLPTGTVSFSGELIQGKTLTASQTLIDLDGLGTITFQWQSDSGLLGTGPTYQLKEADVGKNIQLAATYTDGHGTAESVSYQSTQLVANVNEAAQGNVWIDGTPRENSYINGRWNNIADQDGVGTFKFEWRADGKLLGTDSNLFITESMVDKKIIFSLIFIDGHGTQETLSSKESAPVINENQMVQGYVRIKGEPTLGKTLSIDYKLSDVDGLGPVSIEWRADGDRIVGTGQSLLLDNSVLWNNLRAYVRYVDGHGTDEWLSVQSYRNVVPANASPVGEVFITGSLIQGATLKASHNLTDADGMGAVEYRWYADQIKIGSALGAELILTADLVGKSIAAEVYYTDKHNCEEQVRSKDSVAVANLNDLPTGAVFITGVPTQGQTLTAFNSLKDPDGLGVIAYQWSANGKALPSATTDKLVLSESQVGQLISVTASYKDLFGANESVTGSLSTPIANINDLPGGSVSLIGDLWVGQVLQIKSSLTDADGLGEFSYQWKADGVDIAGATQNTYQLTNKQLGKQITAQIFYVDGHGTSEKMSTQSGNFVRELILGSNSLDDVLRGQTLVDQLQGLGGKDTLFGGAGQDLLMGGQGDDELSGGTGEDILDGGEGYDRALYGETGNTVVMNLSFRWVFQNNAVGSMVSVRDEFGQNDQWLSIEAVHVIGSTQNDNLQLTIGNDIVSGEDGNDYIVGWAGDDLLFGNAGNDHLRPGSGKDTVDGGEGWDHVDYWEEASDLPELGGYGVFVDLSKRTAIDSWGFTDLLVSIESVSGSQYNDELLGDEFRNWLGGQAGDDLLDGKEGDDSLEGHDGNDTMYGGMGNDWFRGGPGNDEIYGGEGIDHIDYWGEVGSPSEFGKKGVFVDLSSNTVIDNWGYIDFVVDIENVGGSSFDDELIGDGKNNHLVGGPGDDRIDGGAGNDHLRGDAGNDTLNGGEGYDWIDSWIDNNPSNPIKYRGIEANLTTGKLIDSWGNEDTLISIEGVHGTYLSDKIIGDASDNYFNGNDGNDLLLGMGGNDNLNGGNGNDTLNGGGGSDNLDGDVGFDKAIYALSLSNYQVLRNNGESWRVNYKGPTTGATPVAERDGNDNVNRIERLVFADQTLALDLDGNAGTVAKVLGAVLGRDFVKNPFYVGIGIEYLDNRGYDYESLLGVAISAVLGAKPTNKQVVDLLFTNVIGFAPTADQAAPFVKMLDDKSYSINGLAKMAADTPFNLTAINLTGLANTGLPYVEFQG
ncbi:MAG: hypothetical protein RL650_286 [Pseudomonadota bacterium]|jgi:Ca2+-binding RTX toxin-like protein